MRKIFMGFGRGEVRKKRGKKKIAKGKIKNLLLCQH